MDRCAECGGSDDLLLMDDAGPLCLACADLDHLVFLRAGDTALTRRATKASSLAAVVVRWSRSRKRYERQGVLVEGHALALAEQQCLSGEDARARRRERERLRRASADEDKARLGLGACSVWRLGASAGALTPDSHTIRVGL